MLLNQDLYFKLLLSQDDIATVLNNIKLPKIDAKIVDIINWKFSKLIKTAVVRNTVKMSRTAAEFNQLLKIDPPIALAIRKYARVIIRELKSTTIDAKKPSVGLLLDIAASISTAVSVIDLTNENNVNLLLEKLYQYTQDFKEVSSLFSIWTMDIYTLSRIFIHHSQQIIVLAGFYHIQNYAEFLSFIKAENLIQLPVSPVQTPCITTTELSKIINLKAIRSFYMDPLTDRNMKIIIDRLTCNLIAIPVTLSYIRFLLTPLYNKLKNLDDINSLSQLVREMFPSEIANEMLKAAKNFTFSVDVMSDFMIRYLVSLTFS